MIIICDVLRDLVPFVQLKKREKHPWRTVNLPATLLELTLLHGCFSRFLNCANGDKSRNASQITTIVALLKHAKCETYQLL